MQSHKQESQVDSSIYDYFIPTFSQRLRCAAVPGIISALIYVLFFTDTYVALVGDLLLMLITGHAYYRIDSERIYSLVHLTNAICWFLIGALPFLVTKRTMLSILLWVGFGIGIVICGFLIIIVAASLMQY